ncbi:hypothetical protein EYC84_009760 [Monilinia fructicola]|uniref:Uncharacterized protein n=1 Tax=Monilinia fructicola TaxID=38448 RepID=A0A5M9JBH4_MONFR|nr:hypothetical protein EYC84_009760 [Monilinia fructicola]
MGRENVTGWKIEDARGVSDDLYAEVRGRSSDCEGYIGGCYWIYDGCDEAAGRRSVYINSEGINLWSRE